MGSALWGRVFGFLRLVIRFWALLGGAALLAVISVVIFSILGNALFNKPFAGDFETTKLLVACAVFSFLPWCQLSRANVTVDIFTSRMDEKTLAVLRAVASIVAFLFAALLLWRMNAGMQSYLSYREATAILNFPLWLVFPPILFSLFLLSLASLLTLRSDVLASLGLPDRHAEAGGDTDRPAVSF